MIAGLAALTLMVALNDSPVARVAAIGAAFVAIEAATAARLALFAAFGLFALSIIIGAAFLSWMRRAAA